MRLTNTVIGLLTAAIVIYRIFGFDDSAPPKLVVYIVVDQMREDTIDRFGDLFSGGFRYLMDNGVYFSETRHAQAYTVTLAAHFSLATGVHPGREGLTGNYVYDRVANQMFYPVTDTLSKIISSELKPMSYRNINKPTIGDILKETDNQSKVFSVAGKDRTAVLMGGKHPDGVFWTNGGAEYVTSSYYMDSYPDWLIEFNKSRPLHKYFGTVWERLIPDEKLYLERCREDEYPPEATFSWDDSTTFPHKIPSYSEGEEPNYDLFWDFPWVDHVTIDLSELIIKEEQLGRDRHPDMLMVGISMTDGVGHRFGPFSQESMDLFLRLDIKLGEFFDFIDREVGLENTLIVLTSDHGSAPMPEHSTAQGHTAGRFGKRYRIMKSVINTRLAEKWGEGEYIEKIANGSLFYDLDLLVEKGLNQEELNRVVIPQLLEEEWVEKVYTREQLSSDEPLDYDGQLLKNQFHPKWSGDLFLINKEYYVLRSSVGTTHGTPYDYDTHVPLFFSGNNFDNRVIQDSIETVDIAPTIAEILGIFFNGVDGRVLELGESN